MGELEFGVRESSHSILPTNVGEAAPVVSSTEALAAEGSLWCHEDNDGGWVGSVHDRGRVTK